MTQRFCVSERFPASPIPACSNAKTSNTPWNTQHKEVLVAAAMHTTSWAFHWDLRAMAGGNKSDKSSKTIKTVIKS